VKTKHPKIITSKAFILILVFLIGFQWPLSNVSNVLAAADVTKPTFNSIEVDKKEVALRDTVKVSVDAEDLESGIEIINVNYQHPESDRTKNVSLSYNNESKKYEGELQATNELESGKYQVRYIHIKDHSGNVFNLYNDALAPYMDDTTDLSGGDFTVSGTTTDITKPTFQGIEVDKKEVALGDTVKVSINAEDLESGIEVINVNYQHPESDRTKNVSLSYNNESKKYEGKLLVTNELESGKYQVRYIHIKDHSGNVFNLYNDALAPYMDDTTDLSGGDFTVSGTTTDITKPTFENIGVDKKEVALGDTVKISVNAEDLESGIEVINVNYQHPESDRTKNISLSYNNESEKYEGELQVTNELELGNYQVRYVHIKDHSGNVFNLYNDALMPYMDDTTNLSGGDFVNIEPDYPDNPLTQNVLIENENWTNKVIEGDLYIGPDSILSINGNVTVNGDIYVLGAVKNYGDLTVSGTIHARQFSWGYSTLYNGTVLMLGGNNSIGGMNASNKPLTDIPIVLTPNPLVSRNGIVDMEGAVLPIVDMEVEGKAVEQNYNGTFKMDDIDVGDKDVITFTFTDVFGNKIIKESPLTIIDTIHPTASMNTKGGYYATPKEIELTMSEKGNIYYTLDGTIPSETNLLYETPIKITDHTVLKFIAIDKFGNQSDVYTENYSILSVNEITDSSKLVIGNAKPESVVTVQAENSEWNSTAKEDGSFKVEIPNLSAGQNITVFATDIDGIDSEVVELVVKDVTSPAKPEVEEVTDKSIEVTGETEAGAKVTVKVGDEVIGSSTAGEDGTYQVTIPKQKAETEIVITSVDPSGNESPSARVVVKDVTAPAKPEVEEVTDKSIEVTGETEAGAKVTVKVGDEVIGSAMAGEDGVYQVAIPTQKAGTEIVITSVDPSGNESPSAKVVVKDVTAPAKPEVEEVTDKSTEVTGETEAGAKVTVKVGDEVIGSAMAGEDGVYQVAIPTQKAGTEIVITSVDPSGNESPSAKVVVKDVTAPAKPEVEEVTDKSLEVTGETEAGAKVTVKVGDEVIGSAMAGEDGVYQVAIPTQKAGTEIVITSVDPSGNESASTKIVVKDVTAPAKPKVEEVTDKSIEVTGETEAGAKVTVKVGDEIIGSAMAGEDGVYQATIPTQKAGTEIVIISTDASGNESEAAEVFVIGTQTFTDIGSHWAKDEILAMTAKGIVSGFPGDKFKPNDNVTRAQFVAFLNRAIRLESPTIKTKFNDVTKDDWFYQDIINATQAGLVHGYPGNTFRPDKNITREDIVVMMDRFLQAERNDLSEKADITYTDYKEISQYALENVQRASSYGLAKGRTAETFNPKENASRAEAITFISRMLLVLENGKL
jgi:uncharacterized protein YgiM (DUF1202 family)/Skp family chaperone for outer membrane proteins